MSQQDSSSGAESPDAAWNIDTVKQQVQHQLGADKWRNGASWTQLVIKQAVLLHQNNTPNEDAVKSLVEFVNETQVYQDIAVANAIQVQKEIAKANAIKVQEITTAKDSGEYWDTMESVWQFDLTGYAGTFSVALKHRQENKCLLYTNEVVEILTNGQSVETILGDTSTPSVFEKDGVTASVVSRESSQRPNRREDKHHEKNHCRNILGEPIKDSDKSRAHSFPADKECHEWWWPMFQLVTGDQVLKYDSNAIHKLASMRTSKFVFAGEHNNIYDNLQYGIVCPIPIFKEMEDMAKWQCGEGFKVLMVCDSAKTYKKIRMTQDSSLDHIQIASKDDIKYATDLVTRMIRIMADSLVNNWERHLALDGAQPKLDGSRGKMLQSMKQMLVDAEGIFTPTQKDQKDGSLNAPKLYTINYTSMYQNDVEGAKYIHDPFPVLIKAAVNLSFFWCSQINEDKRYERCKLLPGCPSFEEESASSGGTSITSIVGLLDFRDARAPATTFQELIGQEIEFHIVSDDDDDDGITQ